MVRNKQTSRVLLNIRSGSHMYRLGYWGMFLERKERI